MSNHNADVFLPGDIAVKSCGKMGDNTGQTGSRHSLYYSSIFTTQMRTINEAPDADTLSI